MHTYRIYLFSVFIHLTLQLHCCYGELLLIIIMITKCVCAHIYNYTRMYFITTNIHVTDTCDDDVDYVIVQDWYVNLRDPLTARQIQKLLTAVNRGFGFGAPSRMRTCAQASISLPKTWTRLLHFIPPVRTVSGLAIWARFTFIFPYKAPVKPYRFTHPLFFFYPPLLLLLR
jgi:hypothetical protein